MPPAKPSAPRPLSRRRRALQRRSDARPFTKAEIRGILPAAGGEPADPADRARIHQPVSRCWSRSCCRRRRPMSASTARPRPCSRSPTRRRRCSTSARSGCRNSSARSGSTARRRATSSGCRGSWSTNTAARCRASARRSKAAGGRAQDRQCRAQRRVRRADDRGRYAYLPGRQPHRSRARQDAARGRDGVSKPSPRPSTSSARITG